MGSLTAHLLETGDHGRLGFHPSCPVCRQERLLGSLTSESVISRRVQAALASGVLAFSAAAPGAAVAADPDRQQEGVAEPEAPSGGDVDAPDFDPGGETALPFEVAPPTNSPGTGGGSEDTGDGPPVDSEPVDDPDARLLATEPETQTPPAEVDAPVPPADTAPVAPAPPPPAPGPVPTGAPPADPNTPAAPSVPHAVLPSERDSSDSESGRARELKGSPVSDGRSPIRSGTAPPATPPSPPAIGIPPQSPASETPVAALPPTEPVALVQASAPPARNTQPPLVENARTHVVQPGDSLWSIARRLLGRDASAAQIAREVNRLWELNKDRIGTGNPDLLRVGTKLSLR